MSDDLTAAVARLREQADLVGVGDIVSTVLARRTDLRIVLAALEAAQADARKAREALATFMDFAGRLRAMSDEELKAWRQAAKAAM